MNIVRAARLLVVLFAFAVVALPALAQTFPNRTMRIIVPYPPGGSIDLTGRVIAKNLQERVGQSVIVENKPGANAAIGIDDLMRSAPDGHTSSSSRTARSRSIRTCRTSITIRSPTSCRSAGW